MVERKIEDRVRKAVLSFVSAGQSFNSLDIYSMLGVRVNDSEYPIYEQVWDMYKGREMPAYLSEWVTINLECGSYARVWRYYLPKISSKKTKASLRSDGRLELPRESMGHFPLLEQNMFLHVDNDRILLSFNDSSPLLELDPTERIRIPSHIINKVQFADLKNITVECFPNRIEIY